MYPRWELTCEVCRDHLVRYPNKGMSWCSCGTYYVNNMGVYRDKE